MIATVTRQLRWVFLTPYFVVRRLNLPSPIPGADRGEANRANAISILTIAVLGLLFGAIHGLNLGRSSALLNVFMAAIVYVRWLLWLTPEREMRFFKDYRTFSCGTKLTYVTAFVSIVCATWWWALRVVSA